MLRQQFDIPADLRHREEVAGDIEMHAAPAEFRRILQLQARYAPCRKPGFAGGVYLRRQQLTQRLYCPV